MLASASYLTAICALRGYSLAALRSVTLVVNVAQR
jgi:hypothetical protein